MLLWQIGMGWMYDRLAAIPELATLIGSGANAKAFPATKVPKDVSPPYLTVSRATLESSRPIGGREDSTTMLVDVSLWATGNDDTPLVAAMDAIMVSLGETEPEMHEGAQVSCAAVGDLPPNDPPAAPGDPEMVRLGKVFEVFVGAT